MDWFHDRPQLALQVPIPAGHVDAFEDFVFLGGVGESDREVSEGGVETGVDVGDVDAPLVHIGWRYPRSVTSKVTRVRVAARATFLGPHTDQYTGRRWRSIVPVNICSAFSWVT